MWGLLPRWPIQERKVTSTRQSSRFCFTHFFHVAGFGWLWPVLTALVALLAIPFAQSGELVLSGQHWGPFGVDLELLLGFLLALYFVVDSASTVFFTPVMELLTENTYLRSASVTEWQIQKICLVVWPVVPC